MKEQRLANSLYYITLLIILIAIIILLAAPSPSEGSNLPSENGTIDVCFSKTDNCEDELESMVLKADHLKAALYDLDEPDLVGVLKSKEAAADLLVDEDNYAGFGKEIRGTGLMHNKFWLFYNTSGKDYLVTGSTNPTVNDFYKNDNNMLIIKSEFLMRNYEAEFDELKSNGKDKANIHSRIIFNGKLLENYFCPDDGCEEEVVRLISSAKKSVYFMTFSFTSDPIGNVLISRNDELDIKGVFDESQVASQKQYTEYYKMKDEGMDVHIDGNSAKLHHKVFIIDNETVITGSYNPTAGGNERNDENVLVIRDEAVVHGFLVEFYRAFGLVKNES